MFKKLCLIGVGLIGGSIARAARQNGAAEMIIGYGRVQDSENLSKAYEMGVLDNYFLDIGKAVNNADLVIIATPVGSTKNVFEELKPYWSDEAIYSDVGSTKQSVIEAAIEVFGHVPSNFVPAHPIAGAEKSGIEAAIDDLFSDKRLIITPLSETSCEALDEVQHFWRLIGAQVSFMEVNHHDAVLAATSHLPHLLAYSLVDLLRKKDEKEEIFNYAAGGFKDFTRIASSDPTMWMDISLANKNKIIPLLEQMKEELDKLKTALETNDKVLLYETFLNAKQARQRFLDQFD